MSKDRFETGMTLIELMVAIAIVGILMAIAIPVFTRQAKEARLSEAMTNVQGILENQEAYFVRFQRYPAPLPLCPAAPPPPRESQNWPDGGCSAGWALLGWRPDDSIMFRYQTFSLYDAAGDRVNDPKALPFQGTWGINWAAEFPGAVGTLQPWCAVQAVADTDADGAPVFFRSNSYNNATFRCDAGGSSPDDTTPTY